MKKHTSFETFCIIVVSLTDKVDFMLNPAKSERRKQDMERAYQSARDATNIHSLNLIFIALHIT